jgi:hypothetical protein
MFAEFSARWVPRSESLVSRAQMFTAFLVVLEGWSFPIFELDTGGACSRPGDLVGVTSTETASTGANIELASQRGHRERCIQVFSE